jgi:hypothetical protein
MDDDGRCIVKAQRYYCYDRNLCRMLVTHEESSNMLQRNINQAVCNSVTLIRRLAYTSALKRLCCSAWRHALQYGKTPAELVDC